VLSRGSARKPPESRQVPRDRLDAQAVTPPGAQQIDD
jgi:hypothetical protein